MNPRLVGVAGPFKGTVFPLTGGEVSIGRESSNQLWTTDPALSRRQCVISGDAGRFTIRDLGSRNGTLVNGVPVEQRDLCDQDQICIGDSVLVFLLTPEQVILEKSPVELTETSELKGAPVVLHQEDAVYLQTEKLAAAGPQNERVVHDLNSLLKIATGIGKIRDRESLEWQLLGMIFDLVPADCGAILHCDDDCEEFGSSVAWDRHGPRNPVRVSRTVVQRVLRERVGLVINDVPTDKSLGDVATLAELSVHSLLCVPLRGSGKVQGVIYLDSRNKAEHFDEHHLQVMTAVASLACLALENVQRWEGLEEENRRLRTEINLDHNMVGKSARMHEVYELIRRAAPSNSTVLIQGESGTGKEMVARAVHRNSPRADCPFVAINCAALTETLLESELFGHEKGAFTGAVAQKKGRIEVAEGGTLFLDEITEMSLALQPKLLRVLQEREFERVGGTRAIKVDVRVIAATNRSLQQAVEAGTFRKDLYYRLNVVALTLPPLRDRREDIPSLAEHFIAKTSRKCKTSVKSLSLEARAALMGYDWPGNVRELENAIERALVLGTADVILPDDLPDAILETGLPAEASTATYHVALKEMKKQLVLQALQQANGSYIEAAENLGLHPNSLLRLIRNLDLKAAAKAVPEI